MLENPYQSELVPLQRQPLHQIHQIRYYLQSHTCFYLFLLRGRKGEDKSMSLQMKTIHTTAFHGAPEHEYASSWSNGGQNTQLEVQATEFRPLYFGHITRWPSKKIIGFVKEPKAVRIHTPSAERRGTRVFPTTGKYSHLRQETGESTESIVCVPGAKTRFFLEAKKRDWKMVPLQNCLRRLTRKKQKCSGIVSRDIYSACSAGGKWSQRRLTQQAANTAGNTLVPNNNIHMA